MADENKTNINWYPGHMTKAKRMMQEDIKLVDLVIEILDARVPLAGKNPDIDNIAGNKSRLILLNKSDLADPEITKLWVKYFEDNGFHVLKMNSKNPSDIKPVNEIVKKACAEKIERDRKRGIKNRPVRAMVAGIPNAGKSTFINSYAKKAAAKTGNKPGVTKGKQWIRLSSEIELLDTPGILWPKFEDQSVGLKLAMIGSIRDEILNTEDLALELIKILEIRYPGVLQEKYGLKSDTEDNNNSYINENDRSEKNSDVDILYKIAKVRGCLQKGGEPDTFKASNLLLENFRNGKLGRISLEAPEM